MSILPCAPAAPRALCKPALRARGHHAQEAPFVVYLPLDDAGRMDLSAARQQVYDITGGR